MIDYSQILAKNYANKSWSLNGNDYDGLNWYDESPKPTQVELDALAQSTQDKVAKDACKAQAKALLAATDWSILPDVGLSNQDAFVFYRLNLRNLVINPVADVVFEAMPEPIWS